MNQSLKKEKISFMGILILISGLLFFRLYVPEEIDSYNTTILALNYTHGFSSRGFIGTVYYLAGKVLHRDMGNPFMARLFLLGCTFIFFLILMWFVWEILKREKNNDYHYIEYMTIPLVMVVISTFSSEYNFGRVDIFMIAISMLGAMSILAEKAEWLIVPLSAIAVMIHQGYVLMYFNIVLALLFYKYITCEKQRKKYGLIFLLSLVVASVLFLYLELFSHNEALAKEFDSIASFAAGLSFEGAYHKTLLQHELLGVDLYKVEHVYHLKNLEEIILFSFFVWPYIVLAIRIFRGIFSCAITLMEKLKYLVIFAGSLTMLPDFLIKVDYGRWVTSVIVYYLVVFLVLMVIDDVVQKEVEKNLFRIINGNPLWKFLYILPVMLIPFFDVNIDGMVGAIGHVLNREWLHWW